MSLQFQACQIALTEQVRLHPQLYLVTHSAARKVIVISYHPPTMNVFHFGPDLPLLFKLQYI